MKSIFIEAFDHWVIKSLVIEDIRNFGNLFLT